MSVDYLNKTKEFWDAVLGKVEVSLSSMIFKTVISRTHIEKVEKNKIVVFCEDAFVKENMQKKYTKDIKKAIKNITKKDFDITYKVKAIDKTTSRNNNPAPLFKAQKNADELLKEKRLASNISPLFSFENFIMGKNNNLAYAIATAVAERPGEMYNPVFIYSGVGMGKTHLLHAIGNKILKDKPGMRVVYTTGETFTNELIEAIQSGKIKGRNATGEFRRKFRKADVFLIDDVQFVIGRPATQEEFFHTFNALYMAQKQIVITSDRPPKDFEKIEERITSRFSSGIIADIQKPDYEMRSAILRTKRDENNDPISNDVIDFIAERIDTNVRELVGAYLQVVTTAKTTGVLIDIQTAAKKLNETIKEEPAKAVNVNEIIKTVCNYYSVNTKDIKGRKRTKEIVIPRQVAMYLMKEIVDLPYMSIGELLGGRDHTTIMHGVEKISNQMEERGKLKQDVSNVKQLLFTN